MIRHQEMVRLGDVCTVVRDGVKPAEIKKGTSFVGLENVTGDGDLIGVKAVDRGEIGSAKFVFGPSHVLFGKLRPYLRKIARPSFVGICSTDILPLLPSESLNRDYLFHYLRQPEVIELATSRCSGANLPRLSSKILDEFKIPLPPLPEQKRIAGILDQADGLRRKRQQALALTDQLAHSIFRGMFGSRDSRGDRWNTSTVGDAVELTNGRAFKSSDWRTEGLPIIRIQNLKNSDKEFNYFSGDFDELHLVKPGDLLIAWAGQLVSFGVHIWSGPVGVLNQHIFKVTPKGDYSPVFLKYALSEVIERAKSQFHGIDMKHITKSDLVSHSIPNPHIELQTEFAKRVAAVESLKTRNLSASSCDEKIFNSLVQRAFSGDL